jgi:hypothetical protein
MSCVPKNVRQGREPVRRAVFPKEGASGKIVIGVPLVGPGMTGVQKTAPGGHGLRTPRCRYHTDTQGLKGIKKDRAIRPSGPARGPVSGVHVELEPFGPVYSLVPGQSAVEQVGAANRRVQGYYVEFDVPDPARLVPLHVGPRNTAIIPTTTLLPLERLNPQFVRPKWWHFWNWFR